MPGLSLSPPPVLYTGTQWLIIIGLVVVALGIKALAAWWLYKDTTARQRGPWGWIAASIVSTIVTLIVWLIVRPDMRRRAPPPGTSDPAAATSAATGAADPYRTGFGEMAPDPRTESLRPLPDTSTAPSVVPSEAVAPPGALTVTCPRCQNRVTVVRNPSGPTPLRCDNCGATGQL